MKEILELKKDLQDMEFILKMVHRILRRERSTSVWRLIFSHSPIRFTTEIMNMNLKLTFNKAIKI